MNNIIRLKKIPSNIIEEAIFILKENKKIKKSVYSNNFQNKAVLNNDNNKFIVKEAELIIEDYLQNQKNNDSNLKKKVKKLTIINIAFFLLLILSIIF